MHGMSNITRVRKEVEWFASVMEGVLQDNDERGGWSKCSMFWLLERIEEQVKSAREAVVELSVKRFEGLEAGNEFRVLIKEAADIANFAMMVADRAQKIYWKVDKAVDCDDGST